MAEIKKEFFDNCVFKEKGYLSYDEFFALPEGKEHIQKRMDYLMQFKKKGKLLDVGCAFGYYLKEASKNFEVYGIDVSDYAIKKAKTIVGCNENHLIASSAEKLLFENDFFDVIMIIHSIEHIKEYKKVLKECNRVLKKDGILFLDLPTNLFEFPHFLNPTKKSVFQINKFLRKIGLQHKIQFGFDKTHVSCPFPWTVASGKYLKPFFEIKEIKPKKKFKQFFSAGFSIIAKPIK